MEHSGKFNKMRFVMVVSKIQMLIAIASIFAINTCLAESNTKKNQELMQKSYEISLEPGEGAIFLLGDENDLRTVKDDYFSSPRKRYTCDKTGKIDRLLLGFLSGTNSGTYGGAEKMGMTLDEYTERTLKLYRDLGATVVFAYHGNMTGGIGRKYAAVAAKYGLPVILQPNDLYFKEGRYFTSKEEYFTHSNAALARYSDPGDYARRYLIPKLEKEAPDNADASNILAWQPAEELPIDGKDEDALVEYKKAFKRLLPNHLLFQIDSVQSTHKTLAVKKAPYPDICATDRTYTWWTRYGNEPIPGLWTPHVSGRMVFNYIKDYALGAYDLFESPSVMVMQGCANMTWVPAEWGKKFFELEPREDSVSSVAPQLKWMPEQKMFRTINRHFAPKNAWRMQIWMGLARGFKGFLYFSGGPGSSREKWLKVYNNAVNGTDAGRLCLINEDFTTHPHMAEVSQTWKNIRNYESLILNTHPVDDKVVPLKIDGRYMYSGILEDAAGRKYLVLVNGEIGKWDGNSPEKLNYPNTKLKLDKWGEFENYTPLEKPRTIKISIEQANELYDLRTMLSAKEVKNTGMKSLCADLPVDKKLACGLPYDGVFTLGKNEGYLQLPENYDPNKKYPFILFLHGRGGSAMDSNFNCNEFAAFKKRCSEKGFIVAVPGYGSDCWMNESGEKITLAMIDFLGSKLSINPERFYVMGCSMGGASALVFTIRHPEKVTAACDIFGITDYVKFYNNGSYNNSIKVAYGGTPLQKPDYYAERSAVNYINILKNKPLLVIHGNCDAIVPKLHSDELVEKLKAANADVEYIVVPGVGHYNSIIKGLENKVIDFFESHK